MNSRLMALGLLLTALFLGGVLLYNGCGSDPRENTAGSNTPREDAQTGNNLDLAMQAITTNRIGRDIGIGERLGASLLQ